MKLDFYQEPGPKSLGKEWVMEHVHPILNSALPDPAVLIATFTEHCAVQIAENLIPEQNVLITGGGAYNKHLISRIKYHCPEVEIKIPEHKLLEYKEAMIFGFMGLLKTLGEVNCLASVTGASKDHCSGVIHTPTV